MSSALLVEELWWSVTTAKRATLGKMVAGEAPEDLAAEAITLDRLHAIAGFRLEEEAATEAWVVQAAAAVMVGMGARSRSPVLYLR